MLGLDKLADLLFGYDYFISYAHADGQVYARELANGLQGHGFSVFLDERVYVAGDDLQRATRRRVRMSKKLVVIVRSHSLSSEWVLKEIEISIAAKRVPIVIDINNALADAPSDNPIKANLNDKIFVSATLEDPHGTPSDAVIADLARSFQAARQQSVRIRSLGCAALIFAAIAVVAVLQYREARANAIEFYVLCDTTRTQVTAGINKLSRLGEGSEFGRLVFGIAEKVARLPDPATLRCGEDPR